ncbi:MAG: sugar phosphate isomerase/epimerase [Rhodospirillales bacterium]|nr:sugar phosphate isomerase/epimerase [Rhodospirillales bacterium]
MAATDKPNRAPPESLIHRGVGRVEFFDMTDEELKNMRQLLKALAEEGRHLFSFHAPISRPAWFWHSGVACFFMNEDTKARELSFRLLAETLQYARSWQAQHVVTHLTYGPADCKDEATARKLAAAAGARMAAMSKASGIPIDIEFAAYTDSFHKADNFAEMIDEHPELGICLDVGHVFIGAQKRERDYWKDIETLAPRTRSMHLWNTRGADDVKANGHLPLHPSQSPKDGWIDIEGTLRAVLSASPEASIVFEYPVDRITPAIQKGYDWVSQFVQKTKQIIQGEKE